MKLLTSIFTFLILPFFVSDGYKMGSKVDNFTLKNAVDNKEITLHNYLNKKAVVLIFTTNECPYSLLYEDRIMDLYNEFKDKDVKFILINPNSELEAEESVAAMVRRVNHKKYIFPYAADPDQKVANMFGAHKTPEAFVLESKNGSFILRYRGAIDDNPQTAEKVTVHYLKDAIASVTCNNTVKVTNTKPTGCMLKKNQ